MAAPNIFRKVSLDRLASPEQLDQLMQVTDRRGWIALAAAGVVIAAAIVWGVAGSLHENVAGQGILIKSGGVYEVIPTSSGRVTDVSVVVGDSVIEGQVVARIAQPELAAQLQEARATLTTLESDHQHLVDFGSRDLVLQLDLLRQRRAAIEHGIASTRQTIGWLSEKISSQERLVEEGLLTRPTLIATRQQYAQARAQTDDAASELAQMSVHELELRNQREAGLRTSTTKLDAQQREIAELERTLRARSEVVAPATGRVLEIMSERGSVVAAGEPILTLDLTGRAVQELEAVIYVPSVHGKQIRPGMTIQIAPSTVKQEEYGLMLGRVSYVSDFPATTKGMGRVLKNERLVTELSGQDAPYEVHADLLVDPATVSHYRWSSSSGPPLRIQSGTLAMANIVVSAERPIEMVIPMLRRAVGLSVIQ